MNKIQPTKPRTAILPKPPGITPVKPSGVEGTKQTQPTLDEIRQKVSPFQRGLLDETWQHFRRTGGWPILREMYCKHGGKQKIRDTLSELTGNVGIEGDSSRRWKTYRLSLLGALLTKDGSSLQARMVSYFDYQRSLFQKEPAKDYSTAAEIAGTLKLNSEQTSILGQLLYLGNLGGSENPKTDWGASAMEEATEFPPEGDLSAQFDKWVCRLYDPRAAVFEDQRNTRLSRGSFIEPEPGSLLSLVDQVNFPKPPAPKASHRPNTAFIMMWMDRTRPELDDVSNAIKDVCQQFDIEAVRADDVEHADQITKIVLERIKESELLIADLSGARPNVYYEIGYAHALDKRPILYRKEGTRLHFDLSVHNVPVYRNITHLKELLRKRFEEVLGRKLNSSER